MSVFNFLSPETKEKLKISLGMNSRVSLLKDVLPRNGTGAELGVFKGEFSEHILKYNKPANLYLVDVWWTLFGENYPNWGKYTDFGKLKTKDAYNNAERISRKFPNTNTTLFVGDDVEYLKTLPENHLDWVYIDSSHEYEHTLNELRVLQRVMKPEGIIAGHDWTDDPENMHFGVSEAVRKFCAESGYEIFFRDNYTQWAIRKSV